MQDEHDEVIALLADAIPSGDGWLRANCPFCPGLVGKFDKNRSFGFNEHSGYYHCFRCLISGKVEISEEWAPVTKDRHLETSEGDMSPPKGFIPLWVGDGLTAHCLKDAREYLLKRGLDFQTIADAKIGACLDGDFANRIVVPILDVADETWLGYAGRDWTNQQYLRYRYPVGMPRSTIMYQQKALFVETDEPILVVEGVFDALSFFGHAVAVLGKPSPWQVQALSGSKRPVAVVLDGDAWEEGWALARKLKLAGVQAGSVKLPAGEDPNSVDHDWLRNEAARCVA